MQTQSTFNGCKGVALKGPRVVCVHQGGALISLCPKVGAHPLSVRAEGPNNYRRIIDGPDVYLRYGAAAHRPAQGRVAHDADWRQCAPSTPT